MKLDKADQLFSLYIRTRDDFICQRCKKKSDSVACSHFYGRRNESTRYEPDNCVTLCYGCHKYFDETNRESYRDFKLKQLGKKRFNTLKVQVNTYKRKDRKMEALIWKKAISSLEGGAR
jgi:5-methylcytosine-specific restriction endonuclease McrA